MRDRQREPQQVGSPELCQCPPNAHPLVLAVGFSFSTASQQQASRNTNAPVASDGEARIVCIEGWLQGHMGAYLREGQGKR